MLLNQVPNNMFFMFLATQGHDKPEGLFYRMEEGYWDVAEGELVTIDRSNESMNVKWMDMYDVAKKYKKTTTWVLSLESTIKEAVAKEKSL